MKVEQRSSKSRIPLLPKPHVLRQGLSVPGANFLQKYGVSEGLATISTDGGHPHPHPHSLATSRLKALGWIAEAIDWLFSFSARLHIAKTRQHRVDLFGRQWQEHIIGVLHQFTTAVA